MSRLVRLDALQTAIRRRANMEGSQFVTDGELVDYVNSDLAEFVDLCIRCDSALYRKAGTINVVANTDTYSLPADFYRLLAVETQAPTGTPARWLNVRRCPFEERNRFALFPVAQRPGYVPFRYYLTGNEAALPVAAMSIVFTPLPSAAATVQVWYAPAAPVLAAPGDQVDGLNGLEEYIVISGAIRCVQKEDPDAGVALERRKAELVQRIESMARDRDEAEPQRMSDVGMTTGWGSGDSEDFF